MTPEKRTPGARRANRGHSSELQPDYTASPASKVISRLASVRETAPGQWIGSCPGALHDRGDRNPSLSIKEEPDGRLLLCCFAGCATDDILAPLGLALADLYPAPLANHKESLTQYQRKRHGQALDALRALRHEALVVHCASGMARQGEVLDDDAIARLALAEYRIKKASEVVA